MNSEKVLEELTVELSFWGFFRQSAGRVRLGSFSSHGEKMGSFSQRALVHLVCPLNVRRAQFVGDAAVVVDDDDDDVTGAIRHGGTLLGVIHFVTSRMTR